MIRGQNKGGKSAIIRAVKWALYGDTGDINEYKKPLDILNRDAKNNGNFQFSVSFVLENNGNRIEVTRTMKATDGISNPKNSDFVPTFTIQEGKKWIYGDALDKYVKDMLSSDISDFFLFDGEMLQQYKGLSTDTASAKKLKNQIERVIKTPYIKTARDDLKIIRRELLQKVGDGTEDRQLQLMYTGLAELVEQEEKYESTSTELTEHIASERETLKGIDSDLATHSAMMDTMRDLEDINKKVSHIESELENTKDILKSQGSSAWTYLASSFIKSKKINLEREESELSNFIDENRTRDILNILYKESSQHCKLCDVVLSVDQKITIKNKLSDYSTQDTAVAEDKLKDVRRLLNKISSSDDLDTLRRQPQKFYDYVAELQECEVEIENLQRQTNSLEQSDIRDLLNRQAECTKEIRRLEDSVERCNQELIGPDATMGNGLYGPEGIQKTKKLHEDYLNKLQKHKPIRDRNQILLDLCTSAETVLSDTLERLIQEVRTEIESFANEMYRKMTVETSSTSLKINEAFGLDVLDVNGERITTSSAGNQIVALSLLYGLKQATGLKGPLLIDTPFARVDLEHRQSMLNTYAEMTDQIILLVHSGEIREGGGLELSIAKNIGSRYTIQKESDTNSTLLRV
jgi:DNA sulfur modification protein DndD|tara:strand:+ start:5220 stop:7121 length:1902 start_codon:yes stop_codon:yes gene_type:complete